MAECTDGNFAQFISQADTSIAEDGNIAIQLNESYICMYYTQVEQYRLRERASQHRQETQISVHYLSSVEIATLLRSTLQHYMFWPQTAIFRCLYITDILLKLY